MRPHRAFPAVLLSCGLVAAGHAQTVRNVASLAGIAGVEIVVEDPGPGLQRLGVSGLTLRADVELLLRRGGVRVIGQVDACDSLPCLYVHVTATTGPGTSAYFVHVGLQQMVSLSRNPSFAVSVETWHAQGRVGLVTGGRMPGRVADAVSSEVAQFVNALHNANRGR